MEGYIRGWSHISLPDVDIDSSHYSFCLFLLKDSGGEGTHTHTAAMAGESSCGWEPHDWVSQEPGVMISFPPSLPEMFFVQFLTVNLLHTYFITKCTNICTVIVAFVQVVTLNMNIPLEKKTICMYKITDANFCLQTKMS